MEDSLLFFFMQPGVFLLGNQSRSFGNQGYKVFTHVRDYSVISAGEGKDMAPVLEN